jgi:SAM-dependent methyltransferase
MLNWAARYFPILRVLKQQLAETDSLLEVGSGPVGIGKFYHARFVGCDISFPSRPKAPMTPVIASAATLPFGDGSFDAVVASDVLEHVPPDQRVVVIREALRVARKVAVFAFPSGSTAYESDRRLAESYDRARQDRPVWLEEHMQYQPFPTEELFEELPHDWRVGSFDNENAAFHNWVMRQEMHRLGIYFFMFLLAVLPRVMESLLRRADREPYYRKIVVVQHHTNSEMIAAEP